METVVETQVYLAAAKRVGMTEGEMTAAVNLLSANPRAGDLMVGSGGCRKVRLAGRGRGKSGGYRLITFYRVGEMVYLLTVISKGDRENLTDAENNALAALVKAL